jgi:putative ABC transport system permease protein
MMALSLRLLRRDWRAGELRTLVAALLIAVTCVSSVAFFTDRIAQALRYQSSELLGADLRWVADHPLPKKIAALVRDLGLATAQTQAFRSMIVSGTAARLAEIKAVSNGYPLRGSLRIAAGAFAADTPTDTIPSPGEAWADARLLQQLQLTVGDRVRVGELSLRISAVLSFEPDRSGDMFSIAPRLLMNVADLAATGLVQEGSRIRYSLLVAGRQAAIERFRQRVQPLLQRGERIETAADARREVRVALTRAQQFLGLASVVALVLACVAIAMAARRFAQRHLATCAILRCLGAHQGDINRLFLNQLLLLAVLSGGVGVLLGYFAQGVLVSLLGQLVLAQLPPPSWTPLGIGLGVALGSLLGFALPPVLQLKEVPALFVLQKAVMQKTAAWRGLRPLGLSAYAVGLLALGLLVLFQSADLKLGGLMLAGLATTTVVLWLMAALLVFGLKRLRQRGTASWQLGLQNLTRRSGASMVQVMAFGVGIMVLLLLTVVRGDILQAWSDALPMDTPNRFVINIQPDQVAAVQAFFSDHGLPQAQLHPMVRGRLTAINGRAVDANGFSDPRAKRLVEREFNLSWAKALQPDNTIVVGRWWRPGEEDKPLFSVEEGLAKTLHIQLGDKLSYNIAGQRFTARVASLRSVRWDSFRANFFVLTPPGALQGFPASYITSFYLPGEQAGALDALVRQFPNLTVIDVAAIMNQVRLIIERVTLAVQYVFLFTLAAGLTVMYAAIQSTLDERVRENAIFRALGARRRRLWRNLIIEFATLGGLAGVLAAVLATVLGYVLATQLLELDYVIDPWLWLAGLLLGAVGVGVAGILGTRQVVNSPPLQVLREG